MNKGMCIDCPYRFIIMEGSFPKEMDTPSGVAFICEADGKILPDFVDEEYDNPECPLEKLKEELLKGE